MLLFSVGNTHTEKKYLEFEGKNNKTLLANESNSIGVVGPVYLLLIKVMFHIKDFISYMFYFFCILRSCMLTLFFLCKSHLLIQETHLKQPKKHTSEQKARLLIVLFVSPVWKAMLVGMKCSKWENLPITRNSSKQKTAKQFS